MQPSRVCGAEDFSCIPRPPASTMPASTTTPQASPYVFEFPAARPADSPQAQAAGPAPAPASQTKAGLKSDQGA